MSCDRMERHVYWDCVATISRKVLRVVAFQAAGSIGETEERVNDAV